MKETKLFDILENAENDSMNRLIDKCPEISDKQLEKILAMSEKKYKMKKKGIEGTMNENDIKKNENDSVEGVEHSRRPAWFAPLSIAASVVLIAGIAIGGTAFMMRNNNNPDNDHVTAPVVTVTSSTVTDNATVTTTATVPSSDVSTVQTETETTANTTAVSDETWDTSGLVGQWEYQVSYGNNTVENGTVSNGAIFINSDGTYSYTDTNGNPVSSGIVKTGYEEIGGTKLKTVNFYNNGSEVEFGGYYDDNAPDEISLGNGGNARLIRGNNAVAADISAFVGKWKYQVSSDGITSVDQKASFNGIVDINSNGIYTYTNPYGNNTEGTVRIDYEEIGGTKLTTVDFLYNTELSFSGYYDPSNPDVISIGNGGMSRLIRQTETNDIHDGNSFIGTWTCGRCIIEIAKNGEQYDVGIHWGSSAQDSSNWKYTCIYDEVSGLLVSDDKGVQTEVHFSSEGIANEKNIYSDGKAKFDIENGILVWQDLNEHAADGMMFELIYT